MKIFNKKEKKKHEYILVANSNNIELDKNTVENVNDNSLNLDEVLDNNYQKNIEESLNSIQIDKEQIINDLLIDAKIDLLPVNLVIGYYEGMTMKGLKEYINGYVFKYFNAPNITSYKILKYNAGFIFEIHDGDYKKSYLNTVINKFNTGNNVVYIKTQHRIAKIIKNYNKIETYMLPEAESNSHPDAIFPEKSTMKPIVTTAFGMIPFGLSIAFMGITSLFLSYIFKTILGKEEELILPTYTMELPSTYIEKLPLATETKYVDKVFYSKNTWSKEFQEIKTEKMIKDEKVDLALSKITNYQNFTNKCFNRSHALDQCNDNNIFFDKADFSNDTFIDNVSMEKGLIKVLFKDTETIQYIPQIIENNLIWKIECSSINIANICMAPNVTIKNNKKSVDIKQDSKIISSDNETSVIIEKPKVIKNTTIKETVVQKKLETKKEAIKVEPIKKEIEKDKKIHNIIKDIKTENIMKTPQIDEVNNTLNKIEETTTPANNKNSIKNTLNLNNLPDNVVVEKK